MWISYGNRSRKVEHSFAQSAEMREKMEENANVGAVLWPDILKVSCCFTKTAAGGIYGSYQIYWNTPEEPGPYTVQLLSGTQVLSQKAEVYGTSVSLEAEIPEKAGCFITVFPTGKESENLLPVPGGSVCRLQEIICEGDKSEGLCGALRLRYTMDSIVPEKVMIQVRLSGGGVRLLPLAPFEKRVSLESLGIDEEESVWLGMGCTYHEQSAVITQEPAEETFVEVCRRAPALTEMTMKMEGRQAGFCIGLAKEGSGSYEAVLSCAGAKVKVKAALSEDKMSLDVQVPFTDFPYGLEQSYLLSMIQKTGMVVLPESEKLAVHLQKPTVEALYQVKKDTFLLKLSGQADTGPKICRAFFRDGNGNTEAVNFMGGELEHMLAAWESVSLAWVNGKAAGPETEPFSLKIPVYRSGEGKEGCSFVYYAEDGRAESGGVVRVEVSVQAFFSEQVHGGVFTLSPPAESETKGAVLEMAETVWPNHQDYDGEKIKSDWLAFLKAAEAAGFDAEDLRELRKTVSVRLPQRVDGGEQTFYRFDMRRRQCGLFPGMSLLVESGRMQWSDDEKGSGYFVGISGAEQVRIPVVCREGKTGLDAFVWLLKDYAQRFEQPEKENYGGLPGGAGTVDLGRKMLRQNYLIVHYPEEFISHCDQGAVRVRKNEYLAAAESLEIMDRDIQLLESQGYLEQVSQGSQAYVVFLRGRVHMTPCFAFWMEGREYWAAVGTTVGDMMDRMGSSFYLLRNGARMETPMVAEQVFREICLAPGDSLIAKEG